MSNGDLSVAEATKTYPLPTTIKTIGEWTIEGDSFTLWKQNIKDSTLTGYNIYVEGVDNILDANSPYGWVRIKTYSDSHIISQ